MKKNIKLPKDFGKMKVKKPKDLFAEWIKTIPKGTPVRVWQNEEMFLVVRDRMDFAFTYSDEKK